MSSQPIMVIDAGNAYIKYVYGNKKGCFVHAFAEIAEHEYASAEQRYGDQFPDDYLRFNKKNKQFAYYVVGESAEQYLSTTRIGAPKYTRDYYGVLFCRAMADAMGDIKTVSGLSVYASHPPIDVQYGDKIPQAISGEWHFTSGGIDRKVSVREVMRYDEIYGGFLMYNLQESQRKVVAVLEGKETGVIDVGGGTISTLIVPGNGRPMYATASSATIGIVDATRTLGEMLKRDFPQYFQVRAIPPYLLRTAIQKGVVTVDGNVMDISSQVARAVNPILSQIRHLYLEKLGHGLGLDTIIITGGGGAMLFDKIKSEIGHSNVVLASDDVEQMHFANVLGAAKFVRIIQEQHT